MHDPIERVYEDIAGGSPALHDWERKYRWHSTPKRSSTLVGGLVPPLVQMVQVSHLLWVNRVQVEQKSEAIKVLLNIIVVWVPSLKRQLGGKLRLSRRLKAGRDCRGPDLQALRIEVAAKPLEVGAEVQHEASQRFVEKRRIRRH
jgi:hypothetical protein